MSTVAAQTRRNGVDTAKLFATLDAVKAAPEAARFRFCVDNRWISGTHNVNRISTFYGVGAEQQRPATFTVEADHPEVRHDASAASRSSAGVGAVSPPTSTSGWSASTVKPAGRCCSAPTP